MFVTQVLCVVPIYNGHGKHGPDFQFTPEQFDDLESLPLYQGDLPAESLVAVGTTLTLYHGKTGDSLFTNLQFVILLGLPKPCSVKKSKAGTGSKGKGKQRA